MFDLILNLIVTIHDRINHDPSIKITDNLIVWSKSISIFLGMIVFDRKSNDQKSLDRSKKIWSVRSLIDLITIIRSFSKYFDWLIDDHMIIFPNDHRSWNDWNITDPQLTFDRDRIKMVIVLKFLYNFFQLWVKSKS